MHTINHMFVQPNERTPNRKKAVSKKKMNEGNGGWNQQKEILGWILDTDKGTIELTDHKKEQVMQIFGELWDKKWISIKKWHQVLGELRFMGAAIAAGLFGAMQLGLTHSEKNHMWITPYLHDHLTDFEMLTCSMMQRLTHLAEIIPDYPSVIGVVDAAQTGMGGYSLLKGST